MSLRPHPHVAPPPPPGHGHRAAPRHRIGEAARRVGVSPSALRLWERQGLVRPARDGGGRYRLYTDADLEHLRGVRRMRQVDRVNAPGIRRLLGKTAGTPDQPSVVDGGRLRELRRAQGLSLRRASQAAGLSISFISALERGASGASVATLQRLTSAYGATLLELFSGAEPNGRLVRRAERPVLELDGSRVRIEQLARGAMHLEPQLFVLAPGASSEGSYAHEGEEFLFLLDGSLTVWVGDGECYQLGPGDALSFPSSLPHRWRNEASEETRLLWINTPPTF
ncbi:MAG: cupin domain-containing protein [Candidatus Limnocylindria bacterium]